MIELIIYMPNILLRSHKFTRYFIYIYIYMEREREREREREIPNTKIYIYIYIASYILWGQKLKFVHWALSLIC